MDTRGEGINFGVILEDEGRWVGVGEGGERREGKGERRGDKENWRV